jgi:hypothetical protein
MTARIPFLLSDPCSHEGAGGEFRRCWIAPSRLAARRCGYGGANL